MKMMLCIPTLQEKNAELSLVSQKEASGLQILNAFFLVFHPQGIYDGDEFIANGLIVCQQCC